MINLNCMTNMELEAHSRKLLDSKDWEGIQRILDFCETKQEYNYKILAKEVTKLADNIKNSK